MPRKESIRNDASRLTSFQVPLIVTEQDIRRLHSSFNELVGPPEWTISFSGGLDRTYANLEEVLAIENPLTCRMCAVTIESRSAQPSITASLTLTDQEHANTTLHLDGPEDPVIKLNQHIQDRLQAMRPWYARATRTDFVSFVFMGLAVLYVLSFVVALLIPSKVVNTPVSSETQVKVAAILVLAVVGAMVAGLVLNKLRAKLFPTTTFALGQGKARHQHLENIRWGVVIAFFVGVAGSLVVALV
jgi:hypothetical protein